MAEASWSFVWMQMSRGGQVGMEDTTCKATCPESMSEIRESDSDDSCDCSSAGQRLKAKSEPFSSLACVSAAWDRK